jgi:hypothetical protein
MKIKIKKNHFVGFGIGLLSPLLFIPIVLFILASVTSVSYGYIWEQFITFPEYTSKYTSLALISNLLWFYMLLNREYYDVARGIIFAMLCFIPYMIYVNLF